MANYADFFKFWSLPVPSALDAGRSGVDADFMTHCHPRTFGQGALTFFEPVEQHKWTAIVAEGFPDFDGIVQPIGHDWQGRLFCIDTRDQEILRFDPETAEVVTAAEDLPTFLNEVVDFPEDIFEQTLAEQWTAVHGPVPAGRCVAFKTPLRLGGKDTPENREVADLEVTWGLLTSIHAQS